MHTSACVPTQGVYVSCQRRENHELFCWPTLCHFQSIAHLHLSLVVRFRLACRKAVLNLRSAMQDRCTLRLSICLSDLQDNIQHNVSLIWLMLH